MHKIIPSFFYANNALILTLCLLMPMTSMGAEQTGRAPDTHSTNKLIIASTNPFPPANTSSKQDNQLLLSNRNTTVSVFPQVAKDHDIYSKWFGIHLLAGYSHNQADFIVTIVTLSFVLLVLLVGLLFHLQSIRRVQRTLYESENKYRSLVDNLPQSVFIKDTNLNYVSCNRNYAAELGIMPEQIVGKNDFDFHPEYAEGYRNDDLRVLTEKSTITVEEKYIKDDHILNVHTTKTPTFDDKGKLTGILGIFWDITENKKMENALKEQEQHMRIFMHSTSDCIWNWDMVMNTAERSIGFEHAFGYTAKEMLPGIEWWIDRIHPDDRERVMQTFNTALETGQSVCNYEYRFRGKDGAYAIVEDQSSIIRDETDKPVRALGAMRDITQRKHAESELMNTHQSLKQIQYAMDQVGIGIHIVDIHGQFSYVNEAASIMLGYRPQEMLQMGVPDIDPNIPADKFEELSAPLRVSEPGRIETTQTTKDGQTIPVEVSFHFIPGETETDGHFISFLVNLTERKQAEKEKDRLQQQLLQATKMETIGQLTGGIAHDFNNILGAMLGYTELLQDCLNKQEIQKEKCIDYLNQILKSGNRAKEVIAKMLLFSRKPPLQSESVIPIIKLQPVMNEVIDFLHASLPASIELSSQINDENITARIQGVQLHQILLNLGINARDAIDIYGHITFRQSSRRLQGQCDSCHSQFSGDYVELSVTDDGKGISADLMNNIFDPFFSTKEFGQGSGMGLSVVHGIAHAANGHIMISNQKQGGACISILLPCVTEKETDLAMNKTSMPEAIKPKLLQDMKLMVVDDEPALIAMLEALLSSHGAVVTGYVDPTDALAEFNKDPANIDLVITDMTMPGISGLDMSRKMLQQQPNLPIILCTGYSERVNEAITLQNGITRFMLKPVNIPELIDTIHQLVTAPCDVS